MIRCEDFERHLLDLHQGTISAELQSALEEHRRICKSCRELTPELIQIRQRLMTLVKLEPRPGFEMRLARRLQFESQGQPKRQWGWDGSLVTNWLAFGVGAVATVLVGFMIFTSHPGGPTATNPMTAENQKIQTPVPSIEKAQNTEQPRVSNPELLVRGRENLPLGRVDDSTGQFLLTAGKDSVPLNQAPNRDWQGEAVSQPK
jgi:hypothetical protein